MIEEYFGTYKEELELIDAQNRVELDLYSIIAHIIRSTKFAHNISLRDVTGRRVSNFSKTFKGNSGFPDFIIRSREKNKDADILGAVEIKYMSKDLNNPNNIKQLYGHIESYKKVIYTNGLEWRFYNDFTLFNGQPVILGKYNNGAFQWNEEESWNKLLNTLNEFFNGFDYLRKCNNAEYK